MTTAPQDAPHQGMALLRALADEGNPVFSTADARNAAEEVGIGGAYLKELLRRLVGAGWIERIKRGTYVITAGIPGLPLELHPFAVGMALIEPCAVSGWSALNYHGLTEQIPRVITLATPKRVATPAMRGAAETEPSIWEVAEHRFEIVTIVPDHFFGYEEIWLGENRVRILDRERAILDCFALPRRFGGVSEGLAIVEEHLHELDVPRLVSHAQRYRKASVAKRVGYALEMAGADDDAIAPLQELSVKGYRLLDPTRPPTGSTIDRWQLRDNLRGSAAE